MSITVKLALKEGKVPLYQTLESNVAAIKIARRLGYERYAQHFAVRLNTDVHPHRSQRAQIHNDSAAFFFPQG